MIYDLKGNILKKARRAIPKSMTPKPDIQLAFTVEDVYVVNDRIFILRVDSKKSTEQETYIRQIAEYDLDLQLTKIYVLPESITISPIGSGWASWYHKFIVKDNLFIFMVSKPVEHLVAFTP